MEKKLIELARLKQELLGKRINFRLCPNCDDAIELECQIADIDKEGERLLKEYENGNNE